MLSEFAHLEEPRDEAEAVAYLNRLQNIKGVGRSVPRSRVNFPVVRRASNPDTHFTTMSEERVVELYFKPYSIPEETEYTYQQHIATLNIASAPDPVCRLLQELYSAKFASDRHRAWLARNRGHP